MKVQFGFCIVDPLMTIALGTITERGAGHERMPAFVVDWDRQLNLVCLIQFGNAGNDESDFIVRRLKDVFNTNRRHAESEGPPTIFVMHAPSGGGIDKQRFGGLTRKSHYIYEVGDFTCNPRCRQRRASILDDSLCGPRSHGYVLIAAIVGDIRLMEELKHRPPSRVIRS